MTRTADIKDLLFPVALAPVFTRLAQENYTQTFIIPRSRAVINTDTGQVLGIVSRNYRLITNEEAIALGKQCCRELLGLDEAANLEIFNAIAPDTRSYCHIDLVHHDFAMNLWDIDNAGGETYLPYVRITNSYNTSRVLRFDIGFCRKLCLNGVIFEEETIHFEFVHSRKTFARPVRFKIEKNRFEKLKAQFIESMTLLRKTVIPRHNAAPIFNHVIGIPRKNSISFRTEQEADDYKKLEKTAAGCIDSYYSAMGETAYALFCAVTDVASKPPQNRHLRRDSNSMQKSAGTWITGLKRYIKEQPQPFNAEEYIAVLARPPYAKKWAGPSAGADKTSAWSP